MNGAPNGSPGTSGDQPGTDRISPEPTDVEISEAVLDRETIWLTQHRSDAAALRALGVMALAAPGRDFELLVDADAINLYVPHIPQHADHSEARKLIEYTSNPGIAWGPLTTLDSITVQDPATEPPRATSGLGGSVNGHEPPSHSPYRESGSVARPDLGKHQNRSGPGGGSDKAEDEDQQQPFWRPDETANIRASIEMRAGRLELDARAKELREYRLSGGAAQRLTFVEATTIKPKKAVADIGHTTAGFALLYRGRVNTIFGQSESAKSWFSLACALDVISRGGKVLVIDLEDDQDGFRHQA